MEETEAEEEVHICKREGGDGGGRGREGRESARERGERK